MFDSTSSWQELFQLPPRLRRQHRIHLIGIGGTGLAPIAQVLLELGFQVSGSDQSASERTAALCAKGAEIHIGHDPQHLAPSPDAPLPDLILISSAIPADNPELIAAYAAGLPVIKRSDLLAPLTAHNRVIAIAGAHGKTTTTAMIAHLLARAGYEPGYIIGSAIPDLGASAAGSGDLFVIEADEYDYAFLGLNPHLIILTSLEWDHPDCFPTPEAYENAFRQFIAKLRPGGVIIYCYDDPHLRALRQANRDNSRWISYGSRMGADWTAHNIDISPAGSTYDLHSPTGVAHPVRLTVPGLHNILNSVAALAAANLVGLAPEVGGQSIGAYRGAGRRFELKGEVGGVLIIDDYAHHPTEIRATLAAARASYPDREIWAVYEPHTYSRTRALLDQYDGVFDAADRVIITDIFAAREREDPNVNARQILAMSRHPDAIHIPQLLDVVAHLRAHLRPHSLVIILSAGAATTIGPTLLQEIEPSPG